MIVNVDPMGKSPAPDSFDAGLDVLRKFHLKNAAYVYRMKTPLYRFLSNTALPAGETHHPSAVIKAT